MRYTPTAPLAGWIAYADLNAAGNTNNNAANVLQVTPASGSNPSSPINPATSFTLLDQATGTDTGARLQVDNSGINTTSANGTSSTGGPAYDVFGGVVDGAGVYTYVDAGDVFQLNFSGLDPAKRYTVVLTANRDQAGTRVLDLDLLDADSSTEASGGTTTVLSPTHVQFDADDNTTTGNVARWDDIAPGVDGDFSVRANRVTSIGASSFAPAALMLSETSASGPSAPGAPTGVSAVAGDAAAQVSWTAPASDGGSAITGYTVTPYIGGAAQTPVDVGAILTTNVTGLTNGTAYTFKVAATNSVDTGNQSAASNAITPTAPGSNYANIPISASTGEKPQSKLWEHGGSWWAVMPSTTTAPNGTWVWRREANGTWTNVLKISDSTDAQADVKAVGDVAHILLHDASPELISVEYVSGTNTYQPWSSRPRPRP